ncbi:RING finger protein 207-like isoform X2 [Mya arenaria]|nr:RING finger protein 207-like isoform X2 [Mya arenaria]
MFFCKTCSQPLCLQCREETHHAKMFSSHHVVLHTKHTRDSQKDCKVHREPYILFSTEKKVMLCINCFRDMKVESRSHCVDLETAYKQGCQKIDDTMQSIRDLQCSVRDGILLLKALLEEISTNSEREKHDISILYDAIQEQIAQTRDALVQEIDRQYVEKEELFKNQLVSLRTFLPTLHVHLVTCAAFCSSTSKYEFLDFTYEMMRRLKAIIQVQQPLHPSQTSDIVTEYKTKLAKCLEPLLFPHRNGSPPVTSSATAATRFETNTTITMTSAGVRQDEAACSGESNRNSLQKRKSLKLKLLETKGFFADHCKEFDESHRELMSKVDKLKQSVQELQRDITLRRSLTREITVSDIKSCISTTEEKLDDHLIHVEGKQTGLEKHWEESLEMIAAEQEVYQAQLQDVCRLKSEIGSVKTILHKLMSFMSSIANVTQRLAPKLGKAYNAAEHDNQHQALLNTINTMQPDSQQRCDALRAAEEERDLKQANRVNPMDEELIKTKGLLRAPSQRKESTIKRLSAEIKEPVKDVSVENVDNDSGEAKADEVDVTVNISLEKKTEPTDKDAKDTVDTVEVNIGAVGESIDVDKENVIDNIDTKAEESGTDSLSPNESTDADVHVIPIDADANDISDIIKVGPLIGLSPHMPDIAAEALRSERENSPMASGISPIVESEDTSSFSIVTSDSDEDTATILCSPTSEEAVKPGFVKDMIAKVCEMSKSIESMDEMTMSASKVGELSKSIESVDELAMSSTTVGEMSKSLDDEEEAAKSDCACTAVVFHENDSKAQVSREGESGIENDRVNQFVSINRLDGDGYEVEEGEDNADDVYKTKSLPELAQVFEPGELKQKKRRRSKSEKDRKDDKKNSDVKNR